MHATNVDVAADGGRDRPAEARDDRVVAVGTTSVHRLKKAHCAECSELRAPREDRIFITPAFGIQGWWIAADQFPSAEIDALDAGLGIRELRPYPCAVRACNRTSAIVF